MKIIPTRYLETFLRIAQKLVVLHTFTNRNPVFQVWLLLIVGIILVVLVFVTINFLSPLEGRKLAANGKADAADADKFGLLGSLWFAFSNLCWQGYHVASVHIL